MRLFLLALFVPISWGQVDYQSAGQKALEEQRYADAADIFAKAIVADPKDYTAHFNRGLAFSLLNRHADAIPEYRTVLELQPGLYEAQLNLGISLLANGDAKGAIEPLRGAADQKRDLFRPVFYLGEAELGARQFPEAEKTYLQALALDGKSASAELGLGQAIARQGRLKDAEPHYRKAAALDPSLQNALGELAEAYESANQDSEAIAIFRELPGAEERLGALLLATGKPEEAVMLLEPVVAKSPTSANQLALARAYTIVKQPVKAEPLAARLLAAAPKDYELRMFYARVLRDQRKFSMAAPQFLTAAQTSPTSVEAWTELAGVLVLLEQYPQALAALDKVHELKGEIAGHYFLRALVLDNMHLPKDAIPNYNQFLELSQGKNPDQEFQARNRVKTLELELKKR